MEKSLYDIEGKLDGEGFKAMTHVRDFWLDFTTQGRLSHITGGPRHKGGSFSGRIFARSKKVPTVVVDVDGFYHTSDETLSLDLTIPKKDDRTILVLPFKDKYVIRVTTRR
jgi:hypothetical protein